MARLSSATGSSIPPPDGRCILLAIPRELRDHIYRYALHYDDGVFYLPKRYPIRYPKRPRDTSRFTISADRHPMKEPNCLKRVCKQLYGETKGLNIKHNHHLTFPVTGDRGHSNLTECVLFLETYFLGRTNKLRDTLTHITVEEDEQSGLIASTQSGIIGLCKFSSLVWLQSFCESHPTSDVDVRFAGVSLNASLWYRFAEISSALAILSRGMLAHDVFAMAPLTQDQKRDVQRAVNEILRQWPDFAEHVPRLSNFHLFPYDRVLDEEEWPQWKSSQPNWGSRAWKDLAASWMKDGF